MISRIKTKLARFTKAHFYDLAGVLTGLLVVVCLFSWFVYIINKEHEHATTVAKAYQEQIEACYPRCAPYDVDHAKGDRCFCNTKRTVK